MRLLSSFKHFCYSFDIAVGFLLCSRARHFSNLNISAKFWKNPADLHRFAKIENLDKSIIKNRHTLLSLCAFFSLDFRECKLSACFHCPGQYLEKQSFQYEIIKNQVYKYLSFIITVELNIEIGCDWQWTFLCSFYNNFFGETAVKTLIEVLLKTWKVAIETVQQKFHRV